MLTTDRAEPQHGEDADHVLRAIRQHDADAIALDDAAERQRRGQAIGMILQRAEGHVRAEERQRRQLVSLSRRAAQDLVERAARVIGVVGHPVVVVIQPRACGRPFDWLRAAIIR